MTGRRPQALLAALVGGFALLAPPGAMAATSGEDLAGVGGVRFPERAFVTSVPDGTAPEEVAVTENGVPVERLKISTAAQGDRFAVILAIDASRSMRGRSLRSALIAARRFVDTRPPNLPVGILTFNRVANVVVPPTTDAATLHDALSRTPRATGGSRVWSAAASAIRQVGATGYDAGAVVLLSDGAGPPGDQRLALTRFARARHVRVHTVGIASARYSPGNLRSLAQATGGGMLGVSTSAALNRVYRDLARTLGGAVHLHWLSRAPSDTVVEVVVTARKRLARFEYISPRPPIFRAPPPAAEEAAGGSSTTLPLLAGLSLAAFAAAFYHWRRRANNRRRITDWVGAGDLSDLAEEDEEDFHYMDYAKPVSPLSRATWWPRLVETFEIAYITTPPARYLSFVFLGTTAGTWLCTVAFSPVLGGIVLFGGIYGGRRYIFFKLRRTREKFADQLADSLSAIASAMRAGGTFGTALNVLIEDAPEPSAREFARISSDEQLGIPIEHAIGEVVRRMENRDLEQVAMVCALQRDTGGAGAEAIDRVAETVRARDDIRRLVSNLTAQGRMSRWVMTALPVGVLAMLSIVNPGHIDPLVGTALGQALLGVAVVLVALGSKVISKIVEIEI